MKTRTTIATLVLCLSSALVAAADGYESYLRGAEQVVSAIEGGAEPATQRDALRALADQADALIDPFSARHPACKDYLDAARGLGGTWSSLSLEDIERDYHHDGALPAIEDPTSKALCYQMKDLLVHPLTALRMLDESSVDNAGLKHEIVEVVAHGRALQALMAK